MKSLPLVSVFINSYNHEKYVGQAINSILNQTYKNIEIIIVDDASSDSSPQILERYKKKYPEKIVKLELLENNIGVSRAGNLAISFTNGKYIHGFSSDDRMHPDKIMTQVKYLEKNDEIAVVFTQAAYIDSNGNPLQLQNEIFNIPITNICQQLLHGNFLCAPSSIIRADIFKSIAINPAIKYVQDYDLWLRILKEHEIAIIPKKLVEYRIHGKNLSIFGNSIPLAVRYELVICILEAINSWPLEKLLPLFVEQDSLTSAKAKAKAFAFISQHCLNIDIQYFGKSLLATDTAYRFALKGLLIDPDSAECQQALCRVYEAMGDRERAETGNSIDLEKWKSIYLTFNLGPLKTGEKLRVITLESPSYHLTATHQEPTLVNQEQVVENNEENNYAVWHDRHRWSTSAVARLAEQVASSVASGVGVHFLVIAAADESNALANTIDTLATQGSAGWRLTVFSPDPCPNPLFETEPTLAWVQITAAEELPLSLNKAIALSSADWFMISPPGIRLEPPFVSLVLAASIRHPNWLCLYFDEERINDRGQVTDPRLKPDANIELLRSSAYVGHAVLAHRVLWPTLNLYLAAMPRAFAFDAALRAVESGGEATLGHIDELAVALPETVDGTPEDWTLIAKPLLEGHLQRSSLIVNVNDGYLPATFFVDYQLTATPLISIIIPIKDRLDLLQPCIESLLEKTQYSHYELIVVDNNNTDLTTLAYLEHLPTHDKKIRVLTYKDNDNNYSAVNNFAAQQANGDFLLLLNNDTLIFQENWLDRMVAIGLNENIGAVGCRLVSTDQKVKNAGIILGLNGIADLIGTELFLTESGYMGRAQLTQNFSAITATCMLVRKALFLEVGGFDEKYFSNFYYDADLCLKLGDRGYRIVWTPFVTLACQNKSDANTKHDAKQEPNDSVSRKAFIKKWHSRLGNDPAYNRHLSLRQRQWMIDGDFDVPWHPDFESLPRIVAQAPDEMGVGQYRMMGPLKELADNGRICRFQLPPLNNDKRFMPFVSELIRAKPTVLFLQNAFSEFHLEDLQNYAELLPDLFRVFGQDDIVFSVPPKSSAKKHFGKDTKARVRRAVELCHRAIVATEPIAEAMRGMVDDIRVVPNYLERSRWGNLQPPGNERRKPRVGWAGAQQHQGDLEFILPVVEATANEIDWIFMGLCPPKLRYHVAEVHNAVVFDEYPAGLAALDLDLAIAPLELNRFNTAKSNLRLLEYGAVGYPVIATDILPYRNAPVTRVPNNPKAWIDAIRAHIHDLDATRTAGEQLRQWVLSNWMLDQHLDEWMKALLPD